MTATSPDGDKCAADGKGWTAYVLGSNLFLKKFTDYPATKEAPGEGEVDVYPGAGFLEFEVQGPYTDIAAAGTLPWTIQWRVVKVPKLGNHRGEEQRARGFRQATARALTLGAKLDQGARLTLRAVGLTAP